MNTLYYTACCEALKKEMRLILPNDAWVSIFKVLKITGMVVITLQKHCFAIFKHIFIHKRTCTSKVPCLAHHKKALRLEGLFC